MDKITETFVSAVRFVRSNPQIIYTLFLLVIIPFAFFFTSQRFLSVASENQDRSERSRIGLLEDAFALFAGEHVGETNYLNERIRAIAKENETMVTFSVLGNGTSSDSLPVVASLSDAEIGTMITLDPQSAYLLTTARGMPEKSFAMEYFVSGTRYWRSMRAITREGMGEVLGFVLVDLSMAQADNVSRNNIFNAYIVLIGVLLLIILLLARQARIIDYASLYARLKEVDRMKDDFVSMAAHELRSPLTIIRGYADLLKDIGGITPEGQQHVAHIDHSAQELNGLIGDILDVAKLQEGRMSFEYEDLPAGPAIAVVVEEFQKPAQDKGLALHFTESDLPAIRVDKGRFHQVLVNFVSNAIKYTPHGEVRVSAEVVRDMLEVRVSDTGMGISAEDQKKIFQKFFRVKSAETSEITGTGLGLWITAEIVRQMKGTISVESIKGKGTDFIVSFPLA